jgi:hypothetical protein
VAIGVEKSAARERYSDCAEASRSRLCSALIPYVASHGANHSKARSSPLPLARERIKVRVSTTPTVFDREFDPNDSYARHHPIQLRALLPDNRNRIYNTRRDADEEFVAGEISVPQMAPKNPLSMSCLLPKDASAIHKAYCS